MACSVENGPDWVCVMRHAISSIDEEIIISSSDGKRFRINQDVAKAASPYFCALLESGMSESGKFSSVFCQILPHLAMFRNHLMSRPDLMHIL
jgi:hypothetical protein